ncbi:HAD family hydrolase [Halorarum halobium]|uniref:HAD family hydrolase n=1 Tax=Halorarum halobium TaxID=3075121 RepID=UPI0028AF20DE|nr:HAD hydrolase-like protein [Halobaculum sp. XH14]
MNRADFREFDAVVYDLDGTLVRLAVDWDEATRDVVTLFERHGHETNGMGLWELLERADDVGLRTELEEILAEHERDGARLSERLSPADDLPLSVATGVCSLNCESACRVALEGHRLSDHVDAVVGRDTVGTYKPDPEPLLATLRMLETPPEEALFVGDSERDELTADRAGVAFEWV